MKDFFQKKRDNTIHFLLKRLIGLCPSCSAAFLVFININTRKAYAYPMKNKGTFDVINALHKFFNDVKEVKVLCSDQDSAYLST